MVHENQSELVACEFEATGFIATVKSAKNVEVSLSTRKVTIVEAQAAKDDIFGELQFNFAPTNNGVMVSW